MLCFLLAALVLRVVAIFLFRFCIVAGVVHRTKEKTEPGNLTKKKSRISGKFYLRITKWPIFVSSIMKTVPYALYTYEW